MIKKLFQKYPDEVAQVRCYQIYNNHIYDVLNHNAEIVYRKTDELVIPNLTSKNCTTKYVDNLLQIIKSVRSTQSTVMNEQSSRSHMIIEINIGSRNFTIADLAGQEFGKTSANNSGAIQKDSTQINKSLLALKECMRATVSNNSHVPFRRSVLTMALKPMFITNCYAAILCTLYPKFLYQTIDTLKYASSLQNNETIQPVAVYAIDSYQTYLEQSKKLSEQEELLLQEARGSLILPQAKVHKLMNNRTLLSKNLSKRLKGFRTKKKKKSVKQAVKQAWAEVTPTITEVDSITPSPIINDTEDNSITPSPIINDTEDDSITPSPIINDTEDNSITPSPTTCNENDYCNESFEVDTDSEDLLFTGVRILEDLKYRYK